MARTSFILSVIPWQEPVTFYQLYHGKNQLHFISHTVARTSYISMRWYLLCTRLTFFKKNGWICILVPHWSNSPYRLCLQKTPSFPVNLFTLTPKFCFVTVAAANTNFIVFHLTQLGLYHMIYFTHGRHTTGKAMENWLLVSPNIGKFA